MPGSRSERMSGEMVTEPLRHLAYVAADAHLRERSGRGDHRQLGVHLPDVEVEHERRLGVALPVVERGPHHGVRQLPEQSAAGDRNREPHHPEAGERQLVDALPTRQDVLVGKAPPLGAGQISHTRIEAGVVGEPLLGQDLERPEVLELEASPSDSVAKDLPAAGPLDRLAGAEQVLPELLARHLVDEAVVVAFARELVAAAGDLPDQLRELLRDPAEHEEGGADSNLVEQRQCGAGVALDPALETTPLPGLDHARERCRLEVVLHGDRRDVAFRHVAAKFAHVSPMRTLVIPTGPVRRPAPGRAARPAAAATEGSAAVSGSW